MHGLGRVRDQRLLERRIAPGLGDHACAVMRADFGLVGLDHRIERGRIDIAFLGENGLQRPHAQLHLRQFGAVMMAIVIVFVRHPALLPFRPWECATL